MSEQTRQMIDSIWPEGSIWSPAPDDDLDKLLDGIALNWDSPRDFLAELATLRNPNTTTFLSDLERDFGVLTNSSLTETQRRAGLRPLVYNRDSNGSDDRLQMALDDAGFNAQVHQNSPAIDPAIFIDQVFQVVLGGGNAFLGRADAFMGLLGGEWLVNGEQFSIEQVYTSQMGQSFIGDVGLGEFTGIERTKKVYTTPTDPDSWPFCFFVGGDATRSSGSNFIALGQTSRGWRGMTTGSNGDVYASVSGGDIYKQTGGAGDFIALGQTSRTWRGMTTGSSGDVYASVNGGDIYKQTGGAGDFIALGQTSRTWRGMTTGSSGDVYASVIGGDIYKQAGGAGDFIALGQTSRGWRGMTAGSSGDVYACVDFGDIYKQTGGAGDFIALGQTLRAWQFMTTGSNGDVYACVSGGDIYKQTGGAGDFIALGQTSRTWLGMTTGSSGDVYASVIGGDIYKQALTGTVLTAIESAEIPSAQEQEFKRIILKYKPMFTWAGLIVTYT